MAVISPFRGLLYDPSRVGDPSLVIAPPYDVISPGEQAALHERHPANIVRVELGMEEPGDDETRNKYARAAERLTRWQSEGILVRDPALAFHVYRQTFRVEGERAPIARIGFFVLARLEESGSASIRPHERTLDAPKADRLALMKACGANVSPIFGLFPDPGGEVAGVLGAAPDEGPPRLRAVDDSGVLHELWTLSDPALAARLVRIFAPREIFIADGHHRYETARSYRDHVRAVDPGVPARATCNYVLMCLTAMEDPGLRILPCHRVLHSQPSFDPAALAARLASLFRIDSLPTDASAEAIRAALAEAGRDGGRALALVLPGDPVRILRLDSAAPLERLRAAGVSEAALSLDVVLLHRLVIEGSLGVGREEQARGGRIGFVHDLGQALAEVRAGRAQAAFLLNPTRVEQVREIASRGETMPQKSTFFYPKLATGLVIHPIVRGEEVPALD